MTRSARMAAAYTYIEAHWLDAITSDDLADKAGITRKSMATYAAERGLPPRSHMLGQRSAEPRAPRVGADDSKHRVRIRNATAELGRRYTALALRMQQAAV